MLKRAIMILTIDFITTEVRFWRWIWFFHFFWWRVNTAKSQPRGRDWWVWEKSWPLQRICWYSHWFYFNDEWPRSIRISLPNRLKEIVCRSCSTLRSSTSLSTKVHKLLLKCSVHSGMPSWEESNRSRDSISTALFLEQSLLSMKCSRYVHKVRSREKGTVGRGESLWVMDWSTPRSDGHIHSIICRPLLNPANTNLHGSSYSRGRVAKLSDKRWQGKPCW